MTYFRPQTYDNHGGSGTWNAVDFYYVNGSNSCGDNAEAGRGKTIRAAHDGTVTFQGPTTISSAACGFGPNVSVRPYYTITIAGSDIEGVPVVTKYIHLTPVDGILNGTVTSVLAGNSIGRNHDLGCARLPHLMFRVFRQGGVTPIPLNTGKVLLDGQEIFRTNRACANWQRPDGVNVYSDSSMPRQDTDGGVEGDDDSDRIENRQDDCADTPQGEAANSDGCSASQRDDDGDRVTDDQDRCADTPQDEPVDAEGCLLIIVDCIGDNDCDDGLFCNGEEQCDDGECIDGESPCAVELGCNESRRVCLVTIRLNSEPGGSGSALTFDFGGTAEIEVPSPPEPGMRFTHWTGDGVTSSNEFDDPLRLPASSNRTITANFIRGPCVPGTCGAGCGCTPGAPAVGMIFFGLLAMRFVGSRRYRTPDRRSVQVTDGE